MNDFLISMGISTVLQLIKKTLKDDDAKSQWKKALRKIYVEIGKAFANDPDFQTK